MKNQGVQIEGFSKYRINTLTHEIYNKHDSLMRPNIDARGRLRINLMSDDGKRKTVVIKDLIRKMGVTTGIIPPKASIEHQIVMCYYDNINSETGLLSVIEWSELIREHVTEANLLHIGRTLNILRKGST